MASTLTCSGAITVDANNRPKCVDGWIVEEINTYLTASEFTDLWAIIIPMFVAAVGVRYLLNVFNLNASRN